MNKKEIIIGGIAVVALIVGLFGGGTVEKIIEKEIGAVVGPEIVSDIIIRGSLTTGKAVLATTTGTANTLNYSDLFNYSYIDALPNVGATTWTLPATSTMYKLLPKDGDTRSWLIHNASSTEAITLTIASGTGMEFGSTTSAVIQESEWAELICTNIYYRTADNEDFFCTVETIYDED